MISSQLGFPSNRLNIHDRAVNTFLILGFLCYSCYYYCITHYYYSMYARYFSTDYFASTSFVFAKTSQKSKTCRYFLHPHVPRAITS